MSLKIRWETEVTVGQLLECLQERFPQKDLALIQQASAFSETHYATFIYPIGKPYVQYALDIALILNDLHADSIVIAAALLYPPPPVPRNILDDLKHDFKDQKEVVGLVEDVLRLEQLEWDNWPTTSGHSTPMERKEVLQKMCLLAIGETKGEGHAVSPQDISAIAQFQKRERQVEHVINMFLVATADVRALIIKLVDRLLLMKVLKAVPQSVKELIPYEFLAKITLAIYAPLADRLGMWRLKSELEDMAFRLLESEKYKAIATQLKAKQQEREIIIHDIIPIVREALISFGGIEAEIVGRPKHIYSIYQKMEAKQLEVAEINDLLGIRILLNTINDCYSAQGILHELWPPVTEIYDGKAGRDWIANPKENLYQSLHTTICIDGKTVEVQIRTHAMHEIAEYGIASAEFAAHWCYKENKTYRKGKTPRGRHSQDRSKQLAKLREIVKSMPTDQPHEGLKNEQLVVVPEYKDRLKDHIYAITPEGHVIDLSAHATPLDFAYRIHTSLGHTYAGAKVNGRNVRIDHELKNGDIVEIFTSHARKGPSPDWLSKSKLDDELKMDELSKLLSSETREDYIPQWLYKREEINKSRSERRKEKNNLKSNNEDDFMYYVFARTRQARSKIRHWLRNNQKV
jgi:GTP diphosphokinase / guanosine-3',5'-bis(diphosphate) 3'-diphosphatase